METRQCHSSITGELQRIRAHLDSVLGIEVEGVRIAGDQHDLTELPVQLTQVPHVLAILVQSGIPV